MMSLTTSVSPSGSLSFESTSMSIKPSSGTVAESSSATGSWLAFMTITGSIVTVTVAMLLSPSSSSTILYWNSSVPT